MHSGMLKYWSPLNIEKAIFYNGQGSGPVQKTFEELYFNDNNAILSKTKNKLLPIFILHPYA